MPRKPDEIKVPPAAAKIDRDYTGPIFISDIDKTYLDTQIDSLGGLLKAAFESPEKKANVPGFATVLRAVRRGSLETPSQRPLFFVSASPQQMGSRILAKMEFDGIVCDGIIFKNQLAYVRRGNFRRLREQIGFKLLALLSLWFDLPKHASLVFFGDDSESDHLIYCLFSDTLAGRARGTILIELLEFLGVHREEALRIGWYSRYLGDTSQPLHAAYINLDTGSHAAYYARFGSRILASENSLQIAISLFSRNLIRLVAAVTIAKELVLKHDFAPSALATSLERGLSRGMYDLAHLEVVWNSLYEEGILPRPASSIEPPEPIEPKAIIGELDSTDRRLRLAALKRLYSQEGRY